MANILAIMNRFGILKTPSDVLAELAEKHRELRKSLRLTQEDLAKRSGVSLGSLKRFERSGQISLESLVKLAHVLNRLADFDAVFAVDHKLKEIESLFSKRLRNS